MALFTAYFDASGKPDRGGVLSIAGYVSDYRKWARFRIEWARILAGESVSSFHMTDFVSSRGEFAGWRGQTDRRRTFIEDLLVCAKRYTNKAFGGAVVLSDFDSVNRRYQLEEHAGQPYPLCAHYCVRLVRAWQAKNSIKNVEFVFEQGDEPRGKLIELCRADGIEPRFLSKKEVAFQAADLVAWRTRNSFEKVLSPGLTRDTALGAYRSFKEVWKSPHAAFYGNLSRIEKFCQDREIPLRTSAVTIAGG